MAVNSPGAYPVSPRSPKSPIPSSPAGSKNTTHFNFAPLKSPGGPKSPNHYGPKSPSGSKNSTQFNFGPKSPKSPNYGPKSPGGPKSPNSYYGPKSPGGPKSPNSYYSPKSPRQQFTFCPKSPNSSKGSTQFTFCPKSPGSQRSSSTRSRSPNGYHRSSSMGPRSPSSRTDISINSNTSVSTLQNSNGGSKQDVNSTDTASTTSSSWTRCRRSTSDLTDLMEEECSTTATSLSRPCSPRSRAGSIKGGGGGGGLAYLASRRGSRDSQISQASAEDLGPLNFSSNPRGRQRRTSNFLELPVPDHVRPRVCSLPEKPYNPRCGDDLYRLRTFSITNKGGVVNCGDSIINRRSRSNTSVNSTASRHSNHSNLSGVSPGERSPFEGSCCGSSYNNMSSDASVEEVTKFRVVLLGDAGVGKTALVNQFMTSEYMNTYDASLDDEFGEKTVSVLLDGEESEMIFIDHPSVEMSVENSLSTYEPHACVVVYSIVDRSTFKVAEDILNYLWRENYTQDKSVIVVGNKADLARSRVIPINEGKGLASSRDCKFIETSSGIQHNVDELLVGVLKQIRLRESREKKKMRRGSKGGRNPNNRLYGSRTSLSLNIAREILNKMCLNDSKSKSCENLHVL